MTTLQQQYQELNKTLFDERLPSLPCVSNARFRKTLGRCQFQRRGKTIVPVRIEIKRGLSAEEQHKTLVHEMCHVWAMTTHQETGHGPHFWHKMALLGYPKGHVLETGRRDRWSAMPEHDFSVGQVVYFTHKNNTIRGRIRRVNQRTLSVDAANGRWRVPVERLRREP